MAMMQTMQSQDLGQLLQRLSPQELFAFELTLLRCAESMDFVYLHKVNNGHIPRGNVGKHSHPMEHLGLNYFIFFLLAIVWCTMISWVVVSNMFYFHPYLGKIPILTNIFQMG